MLINLKTRRTYKFCKILYDNILFALSTFKQRLILLLSFIYINIIVVHQENIAKNHHQD